MSLPRHLRQLLCVAVLFAAPLPAVAAPRPSISLDLLGADGTPAATLDVNDLQVSVSHSIPADAAAASAGTPDKPAASKLDDINSQMSFTLDNSVLSNPAAIGWIAKAASTASLKVRITGDTPATYTITDLTACVLSITHSVDGGGQGQANLSVTARHLAVNGVMLN